MSSLEGAGQTSWENFQLLLEDQMEWPSEYIFKFIAPSNSLDSLRTVFGHYPVHVKPSSKGNYVSVTARIEMHSSDEIVAIYKAAAQVEGVILL